MQLKKLTITALFIAIGVLSAHLVYIPVVVAKCFPVQHAINILLAVLLGTRYSVSAAFGISLLRNDRFNIRSRDDSNNNRKNNTSKHCDGTILIM